jgi:hypothetical protein
MRNLGINKQPSDIKDKFNAQNLNMQQSLNRMHMYSPANMYYGMDPQNPMGFNNFMPFPPM